LVQVDTEVNEKNPSTANPVTGSAFFMTSERIHHNMQFKNIEENRLIDIHHDNPCGTILH